MEYNKNILHQSHHPSSFNLGSFWFLGNQTPLSSEELNEPYQILFLLLVLLLRVLRWYLQSGLLTLGVVTGTAASRAIRVTRHWVEKKTSRIKNPRMKWENKEDEEREWSRLVTGLKTEEIDRNEMGLYLLLQKNISEWELLFPFPPEQETWNWGVLGGFLRARIGSGYIRS